MSLNFLIQSNVETDENGDPLFWHTHDGWVDIDSATNYSEEDTEWMNLPAQSKWIEKE